MSQTSWNNDMARKVDGLTREFGRTLGQILEGMEKIMAFFDDIEGSLKEIGASLDDIESDLKDLMSKIGGGPLSQVEADAFAADLAKVHDRVAAVSQEWPKP